MSLSFPAAPEEKPPIEIGAELIPETARVEDMLPEIRSVDDPDCPEWVPQGVWPHLKRDLIMMRAGILKDSTRQVADRYNLPIGHVRSLACRKRFELDVQEMKTKLIAASGLAAHDFMAEIHRRMGQGDLQNPKEMKFIDLVKAARMTGDMMHEMDKKDGAPNVNIYGGQVNFGDLKQIIQNRVKKPE